MNKFDFINRKNYETIDELNSLLKYANIEQRVTVTIIDTINQLGVHIFIPAIFSPEKPPFKVEIVEDLNTRTSSIGELVESINYDITDLFNAINPDFKKLIDVKLALKINSELDDSNEIIKQLNIKINDIYYRHN